MPGRIESSNNSLKRETVNNPTDLETAGRIRWAFLN